MQNYYIFKQALSMKLEANFNRDGSGTAGRWGMITPLWFHLNIPTLPELLLICGPW